MPGKLQGALAAAAALLGAALRRGNHKATAELSAEMVGEVPIYNYDLRYLQVGGAAADAASSAELVLDWILTLSGQWTEAELHAFSPGTFHSVGQPGGLPFARLRTTEAGLKSFLAKNAESVEFVEPDLPVYLIPEVEEVNVASGGWDSVWGHETVNLDRATHTGKGVHIYVMDSGIRSTHQDFGGRAVPTVDTMSSGGVLVECDGSDPDCSRDRHGHGTHCAGTAAGAKYGVAKEAVVHAMRVCCSEEGTNIYAGMDYIMAKGPKPAIMTMSLGSFGQSQASKAAVDAMVDGGVTVLVSSGNNNIDACEKTYAFIASAIAVGATTIKNERARYSNYGTCVAIYAPGTGVLSTGHWKDDVQRKMTGTSMATPFTAGAAALLVEEFPAFSPAEIRQEMLRRATRDVLTMLEEGDSNLLLSVVAA